MHGYRKTMIILKGIHTHTLYILYTHNKCVLGVNMSTQEYHAIHCYTCGVCPVVKRGELALLAHSL